MSEGAGFRNLRTIHSTCHDLYNRNLIEPDKKQLTDQENILYPHYSNHKRRSWNHPIQIRSVSNTNLPPLEKTRLQGQLHEALGLHDMIIDQQHWNYILSTKLAFGTAWFPQISLPHFLIYLLDFLSSSFSISTKLTLSWQWCKIQRTSKMLSKHSIKQAFSSSLTHRIIIRKFILNQ